MKLPLTIFLKVSFQLSVLFFPLFLIAQEQTIISGRVYDLTTRETIPFVNLVLNNTTAGTSTDINGNYRLATTLVSDSLTASYIGYKNATKKVIVHKEQVIDFFLEPESQSLSEVQIHPGENPAFKIMRKVMEHKEENDPGNLKAYQFEVYNKLELDLNNIPKKYEQKKVLKPIKFVFNYVDSSNVKEKPYLPAFISESVSDMYYRNNPSVKKEIVKADKMSGLKNQNFAQFTGDLYQEFDLYKNNSLLFGQQFISPLSYSWKGYYKYFLIDSMNINGHWCYQLQFKPKHLEEYAFQGNMWIADTSFALVRIEMAVAGDANLNYVQNFSLAQEYTLVENKYWMLAKNKLVIDFALTQRGMGIYGRKTTLYDHFIINKPMEDNFYNPAKRFFVEDSAGRRSNHYWDSARKEALSKEEKNIYSMVDTFQKLPVYHHVVDAVTLIATGYKTYGDFEIGPVTDFYSHNVVEGDRIRFGGRTSVTFSKWYELNGYLAYGFYDKKMKYDLGFKSFITQNPWQQIEIHYTDDVKVLGRSDRLFHQDNILNSIFSRVPLSNLTEIKEAKFTYDRDIFTGLNLQLSYIHRTYIPTQNQSYLVFDGVGDIDTKPAIFDPELQVNLNFSFNQKYVISSVSRNALGTKYPVFIMKYTRGLQGIFGGDYNYQKLIAGINYNLHINPFGKTRLSAEAGKIWGNVPYPIMFLHPGNETYVFDRLSYNMMNYYEFASDQYLALTAEHHFEGLILNRIPLMRKLKWREVVAYKWLAGSVNPANRQTILFPPAMYSLNSGPYSEADAGIENIFKIIRVDALWRLSYLSHPNISRFTVMGSLEFIF